MQNNDDSDNLNERKFQKDLIAEFGKRGFEFYAQKDEEFRNKAFSENLLGKYLKQQYESISNEEINEIFSNISSMLCNDWFRNNKTGILTILLEGIPTTFTKINNLQSYKLIDFLDIEKNNFNIINEVKISIDSRMDLALLVNGLPIHLFELKSMFRVDRSTDLESAIEQIGRYAKSSPKFFTFSISSIAMNAFNNSIVGSPLLPKEFWFHIVPNYERLDYFFTFFSTTKIMYYLKSGILFSKNNSKNKKYILRHHQVDAIESSVNALTNKKGGYIWHTQGSGKTITISSLIATLFKTKGLASTTTIIDVDRIDLADNIYKTLSGIDEQHFINTELKIAKNGDELKSFLSRNLRGIIVTTTHKFKDWGVVSDRSDILVISDEAHRTHNDSEIKNVEDLSKKSYFEKMKAALPNSLIIGFTGTPIFDDLKPTFKQFGDLLHVYNMKQAEEDGIITKIKYSFVQFNPTLLNDKIMEIDQSKRLRSNVDLIDLHPSRNFLIASEICKVYMNAKADHDLKKNTDSFKVMVVTNQIKQGYIILKKLRELNFLAESEIQFVATPQEANQDHEIYEFLKKQDNKEIYDEFQNENSRTKVLIVTSMLLTGYDVPNLRILFVDKQIQKHNLLQAIARVNRRFENKESGYVVAFRDLTSELNEALETYRETTSDVSSEIIIQTNFEELIERKIEEFVLRGYELESETKTLSYLINETSHSINNLDPVEQKEIREILKEVSDSIPFVMSWRSEKNKRNANIIKIILLHLDRREFENSFISLSDSDFEKILNSVIFDSKNMFYSFKEASVEEICSFKEMSRDSLAKVISNKISKAVKQNNSLTSKEKDTLIEQIVSIIERYSSSKITFYDALEKFKDIENNLSVFDNLNDFTKKLISILKINLDFKINKNDEKLVHVDKWLSNIDFDSIIKTEGSKKDFNRNFRDFLKEEFSISQSSAGRIAIEFTNNYL